MKLTKEYFLKLEHKDQGKGFLSFYKPWKFTSKGKPQHFKSYYMFYDL